ncbi:GNAT family N-acetyltransferase [Saxibacter everestensis]|uniref:GNAT family N-acetyltransferase n=1 Tax=Saxibacter everestensis TaxID=2909229 RepID=A0ABY8QR16_9MICO|nr:GNAT family N-acetyltransferase [Brevibacteriaceae bacterium ZFBP1038]
MKEKLAPIHPGMTSKDTIAVRAATTEHHEFLATHDHHVRPEVLASLIDAGQILVVEAEGEPLGWLRWNLFWDEIPFMNLLFVLGEQRALGLGRALVDAWETTLREQGHKLVLTSTQADEDAQHFYRKLGWTDCGALLLPGDPTEIIFRKVLTE